MHLMYGRRDSGQDRLLGRMPRRADDPGGAGAAGGTGGGAGGASGDGDGDDDPAAGDGDGDPAGKNGKTYSQADVEDIVKRRLEREREKQRKDAEKAQADAKLAQQKQQQQWQDMAGDLEKKVAELQPALEAAEAKLVERDALLEKYRDQVSKLVAERSSSLPAPVVALLGNMDPLERLAWLNDNADELGTQKIGIIPTTPRPGAANADKKKGEAAQAEMKRRTRKL